MKSVTGGDLPGGLALLKRAVAHSDGRERQYLLELLVPLLVNTHHIEDAEEALQATDDTVPELAPAFPALRAVVAARQGDDRRAPGSRAMRCSAPAVDNPMIAGRAWSAPRRRVPPGRFRRGARPRARSRALVRAFGVASQRGDGVPALYVIAHDWAGDPDVAQFYARRMTMSAHLAEDVLLEHLGVLNQLDLAAEAGDARRVTSLRGHLLAHPLNEQYYRERFAYAISEVLSQGWLRRFDVSRIALLALRNSDGLSLPERSLCDALLAVVALSTWHIDLARSTARRVISQTTERSGNEPLFDSRRRRIARVLAAAVCIVIGDTVRGRRRCRASPTRSSGSCRSSARAGSTRSSRRR